ncbi:MAG: hypothetical protein IJA71_05290 [Clostridia bacterium]|nr:hypothetical protein [Clostridia bacterium]
MRYPRIPGRKVYTQALTRFGGLDRQARPGAGSFTHTQNLSARAWPLITPRLRRGVYAKPASPQALIGGDMLCYVDGSDFVIGEERIPMGLSVRPEDCPKRLQAMGTRVIILPDRMYIDLLDPEDRGSLEAVFSGEGVRAELCDEEGTVLEAVALGETAPEEGLWLDTGGEAPVLREYSESQGQWAERGCFVRLTAAGIGSGFFPEDTVRVRGLGGLDGLRRVLLAEAEELVLEGAMIPGEVEGAVEIGRRVPLMDHITECGNRLWGCRYGPDREGNFVNEVYASRLGDPRNWESYQGLSTDSYAVSFGEPGPFTGAASHLGFPVFFREDAIHKIYGSTPEAYRVQTTHCPGVQQGSHESIAQVGSLLVYKGREGVYAYDGSMPVDISRPLGPGKRWDAAAGALGERYYISMAEEDGHSLYVWDSGRNIWHREDGLRCSHFCAQGGELYAIDQGSRNILGLLGTGEAEKDVVWEGELAPFGLEEPERRHISRIVLGLSLEPGARLECLARYDGEDRWQTLAAVFGSEAGSLRLPLRPRRCDRMALKLRGTGNAEIFSITKYYEKGSDCP